MPLFKTCLSFCRKRANRGKNVTGLQWELGKNNGRDAQSYCRRPTQFTVPRVSKKKSPAAICQTFSIRQLECRSKTDLCAFLRSTGCAAYRLDDFSRRLGLSFDALQAIELIVPERRPGCGCQTGKNDSHCEV